MQKLSEQFENSHLLDQANKMTESTLRMCFVMAFVAANCSNNIDRMKFPFLPLLGDNFILNFINLILIIFNFVKKI